MSRISDMFMLERAASISIFVLVSVICETKLKIEIFRRWIYMCTTDVCAPRVHMFLSTVLEQ